MSVDVSDNDNNSMLSATESIPSIDVPTVTNAYRFRNSDVLFIQEEEDLDTFQDIPIIFWSPHERYQNEDLAHMLNTKYSDFMDLSLFIENRPISPTDSSLQRHPPTAEQQQKQEEGNLKWFMKNNFDMGVFDTQFKNILTQEGTTSFLHIKDSNTRAKAIENQIRRISSCFSFVAIVGRESSPIRNKYNMRSALNKAYKKKESLNPIQLQWSFTGLYHTVPKEELDVRNLELLTNDAETSRRALAKHQANNAPVTGTTNATERMMIAALENLNTTIAGRPSVPPEDHTTYNHDPNFYDLSTFPAEVKRRNESANNPYYVYKDSELVPYKFNTKEARSAGFGRIVNDKEEIKRRYYSKFRDIFTIDGSHFHLEYRGSDKMKQFNSNFPVLPKDPDAYQRRLWYIQVLVHCRTHGIYLPPWCTLRPGVHIRGFECDDGKNRDIPSMFDKYLYRWSTHIAEGIMYKNSDIVILNKAGYNWIHNFSQRDYPKFMSKPQDLTLDRPKQRKSESVADFQFRYNDWCMVSGIVEDHAPALNSTVEMNSFISCCLHGPHIHSCIAIDRQNPENASKYTVEQIANTIDTVLREHPPSPKKISPRTRFTGNPYCCTIINQLDEKSDSESDSEDIDDSPSTLHQSQDPQSCYCSS